MPQQPRPSTLYTKQRPRISMRNLRRDLWRKLTEPATIPRHDLAVAFPALLDPGVGAEQEAVGMAFEQGAPFRRQLSAAVGDAAAVGEFAPEFWIFCKH